MHLDCVYIHLATAGTFKHKEELVTSRPVTHKKSTAYMPMGREHSTKFLFE